MNLFTEFCNNRKDDNTDINCFMKQTEWVLAAKLSGN